MWSIWASNGEERNVEDLLKEILAELRKSNELGERALALGQRAIVINSEGMQEARSWRDMNTLVDTLRQTQQGIDDIMQRLKF